MISYHFSRRIPPLKCVGFESEYYYYVTLEMKKNSSKQPLWSTCGRKQYDSISVVNESAQVRLKYHFNTLFHPATGRVGFRFFFSFHQNFSLPSQLSDGRWNCSLPHWTEFKRHFPCNLQAECVGGEDEKDCHYTNVSRCGAGAISLGESCYLYVISKSDVTWNEALDICVRKGAHLADLLSMEEWFDVMGLLTVRAAAIYLGLRSAGLHLTYK